MYRSKGKIVINKIFVIRKVLIHMCITGKCGRMKEMAWIDGHFSGSCIGVLYVLLCKIVVSCHVTDTWILV